MTNAEFFESVYAAADRDDSNVPWQDAVSRPLIADWIASFQPEGSERAVVVAAGLGDDAAAIAAKGLDVVAFDFSPTALGWARSRHAGANVEWHEADLFDLPAEWTAAFDLIIEVFTIQAIGPDRQIAAAEAVKRLLAPGGTIVAVTFLHDGDGPVDGPPWPLHPDTLALLAEGLDETDRLTEELDNGVTCVRVELKSR